MLLIENLSSPSLSSKLKNFRYIHKKDYRKFERKFRLAIELHQDQGFNEILAEKPYHANTLLTLADVYKSQQDFNAEREMLERCLYGLETSLDSRFSLVDPSTKLDYRYLENRCFFICLFQHAASLSRRACNRTAFEVCKLLYKLDDAADPLSIWLMFDHFALLSGQYDWVISAFSDKGPRDQDQNASLLHKDLKLKALPNWCYSVALAKYRKAGKLEPTAEAMKQLTLAIIKFPGLLALLAEKLTIQISDSEKAKLLSFDNGSKYLLILYKLYVNRSHTCWSGDGILPFLYKACQKALSALCNDSCEASNFKHYVDAGEIVRSGYAKLPENVLRHLTISGFSDCNAFINLNYPDDPNSLYAYDPFPPKVQTLWSKKYFTYQPLEDNWRDEVIGGRLDGSALANFLETMIRPNMTINDMLRRTRESEGGPDRPGVLEEIRMNLYELLSGFNVEGDLDEAIEGAIDDFREGEID